MTTHRSIHHSSFQSSWLARYGTAAPEISEELQNDLGPFLVHRSVRHYSEEPISEALVEALIGVANSAATSSNLQLFSILTVQDPERRDAIANLAGNQDQVRGASWLFVFLADHARLRQVALNEGISTEGYGYTEPFIIATVDAALAAERLVTAAETIGLGTCYIGAMRNKPEAICELLNLPDGVFALFGLCIGYPAADDTSSIKPRLGSALWHKETYDPTKSLEQYDAQMAEFFKKERMSSEKTWSVKSAIRMTPGQMSGRESIRASLETQGFLER